MKLYTENEQGKELCIASMRPEKYKIYKELEQENEWFENFCKENLGIDKNDIVNIGIFIGERS